MFHYKKLDVAHFEEGKDADVLKAYHRACMNANRHANKVTNQSPNGREKITESDLMDAFNERNHFINKNQTPFSTATPSTAEQEPIPNMYRQYRHVPSVSELEKNQRIIKE